MTKSKVVKEWAKRNGIEYVDYSSKEIRDMLEAQSPRLNDALREKLRVALAQALVSAMFGDGLELDYVLDGINFKGVKNMTDLELVEEYEACTDPTNDLVVEAKLELRLEDILRAP
jgi:predicted XRE-type DNA-binding protein